MKSILITPESEEQLKELKAWARKAGIKISVISEDDREELGLLKAIEAGRKTKSVSKATVLKNLRA